LSMLMYLSALQPAVAKALGQYYEDKPPEGTKAAIYTLEVLDGKNVGYTASRGLILGVESKMPMIWDVEAHQFDWGVGLKWQGYDAYTSFNIFRSDTYDGVYKKINKAPVQVQAKKNPNGTIDLAPYFYSDTTLEKGKLGFYKVQGLDFFADKGPMTIPVIGQVKIDPHPALLTRPEIKAGETDIIIRWKPSQDEDVVGYNIYRSQKYEDPGEKLNEHLITSTQFKDETVLLDLNYFYSVTAVNKGGYESLPSLNALGIAKDITPPARVQNLAGKVDKAIVKLMWDTVTDKDLLGYQVYPHNIVQVLWQPQVVMLINTSTCSSGYRFAQEIDSIPFDLLRFQRETSALRPPDCPPAFFLHRKNQERLTWQSLPFFLYHLPEPYRGHKYNQTACL